MLRCLRPGNFRGMPKQSLSLREFDTQNEKLLHQSTADSTNWRTYQLRLTGEPARGDGWFRLTQTYGEGLYFSPGAERKVSR